MRLYKWFIWNFRVNSNFRAIDQRLDVLLLEAAILNEASRTRLSTLMVNSLPRLIESYDFRRGFYPQFVRFSMKNDSSYMAELTNTLSNLEGKAIDGSDIEAALVFGMLKLFTMLFSMQTQSAYAMRLRGKILAIRAKNLNDIVQHFLATKLYELDPNWQNSEV